MYLIFLDRFKFIIIIIIIIIISQMRILWKVRNYKIWMKFLNKYTILFWTIENKCLHFCWWGDWFLCLMAYQLFLGYLMPKPFS